MNFTTSNQDPCKEYYIPHNTLELNQIPLGCSGPSVPESSAVAVVIFITLTWLGFGRVLFTFIHSHLLHI